MTEGIDGFLASLGLEGAPRIILAGDASSRGYLRLQGTGFLLMTSPDPAQDIVRFGAIAELLSQFGLTAPCIQAADPNQGLALIEDFGDGTFSRLLNDGSPPLPLYHMATDVLITLHRGFRDTGGLALPRYGLDRFLEQSLLLADHGLPEALGRPMTGAERTALDSALAAVIPVALGLPESLLLRDYHVDNLIRLPDRRGVAACGLLDFQDAGVGPVLYDLVSLLEDARRDVPDAVVRSCRARYLEAFPQLQPETASAAWAVLAALRHMRIIAVFHRLAGRGRPHYLAHLPRVCRLLARALTHPALGPLRGPLQPLSGLGR